MQQTSWRSASGKSGVRSVSSHCANSGGSSMRWFGRSRLLQRFGCEQIGFAPIVVAEARIGIRRQQETKNIANSDRRFRRHALCPISATRSRTAASAASKPIRSAGRANETAST